MMRSPHATAREWPLLSATREKPVQQRRPSTAKNTSGGGGKPSCPSPSAGDLRELPRVPLRIEGSCGGGGVQATLLSTLNLPESIR